MRKNYFIADTHFGHQKIISMCNRPFTDIDDMTINLINKWNNKVTDEDNVYILGDICFKMQKTEIIKILKQLKGHKDKYAGQRDFDECFEKVCDYLQISEGTQQIILSHYPIVDYAGMFYGAKMIYGHVHNKYLPKKNMYCASVECTNYEPVTLQELEEIYKDKYVEEALEWTRPFNEF